METATVPAGTSAAQDALCAKDRDAVVPAGAVHFCVMAYAFAFWFCQPVEPYLLKKLGGDRMTWGYVQSCYGFCMIIGGPIVGRLCDVVGVRVGASVTLLGGAFSYFLVAIAWNLPMMFLSKLPTAVMHTMQVSQTIISHLSLESKRSEALGRLSISYALGMVFGAFFGGFFGERFGYQANSAVSCCISLALIPLVVFLVPSIRPEKKETNEDAPGCCGNFRWIVIYELLTERVFSSLVITSVLVASGIGMHRFTFPNVMMYHFKLKPSEQGVVLAAGAILAVISNVFLIGPTLRATGSERNAVLAMLALFAVCMAGYCQTGPSTLTLFYLLIIPKSYAAAVIGTIMVSLFSKATLVEFLGTAIAIQHAISSASIVILPPLGNFIYTAYGFCVLCITGTVILCVALVHGFFAEGLRVCEADEGERAPLSRA